MKKLIILHALFSNLHGEIDVTRVSWKPFISYIVTLSFAAGQLHLQHRFKLKEFNFSLKSNFANMVPKIALMVVASIALVAANEEDEDYGIDILRMGNIQNLIYVFLFSMIVFSLWLGKHHLEHMGSSLCISVALYCRDVYPGESMDNVVMNEIHEMYNSSDAFEIPDGLLTGMPFAPVISYNLITCIDL